MRLLICSAGFEFEFLVVSNQRSNVRRGGARHYQNREVRRSGVSDLAKLSPKIPVQRTIQTPVFRSMPASDPN